MFKLPQTNPQSNGQDIKVDDFRKILDTLAELVADKVQARLATQNGIVPGKSEPSKLLHSSKETAMSFGVSEQCITAWARDGAPYVQCGARRRYDLDAVRAWLEARTPKRTPKTDSSVKDETGGVRLISRLNGGR